MFHKIEKTLFCPTCTEDKFDSICFNLILFDIFFVPLFPLFSVSMSLPIMIYWYMKSGKKVCFEKEYSLFPVIIFIMFLSTCMSIIGFEDSRYETTFVTSFKRFVQYITSFCYFFFFKYFFIRYKRNISELVFWGIVYIAAYAVFYLLFQDKFISLKQAICPFDPQINRWEDGTMLAVYRFNYLWADPNNVAYAITGLTLFYIIEADCIIRKYIAITLMSFVIICTMSFGGLGISVLLIGYLFLFTKIFRNNHVAIMIGIVSIIAIVLIIIQNYDFFYDMIDGGFLQRQDLYGDDGLKGGGGRISDFMGGFNSFIPILLIFGTGQEGFVTEIGHWYLIFLYGIPVYIYFMYVLFWKRKYLIFREYLPIIPFFIGFTMNIAIGEQKYLLFVLLISAYYSAKSYRKKNGST